MNKSINDKAIILAVKNWQTADKYAVCFTENNGKIRFIAYGARYPKNVVGRLLQPFANLHLDIAIGQKIDRLKSCELVKLPEVFDLNQIAYGAVITEITAVLTEDHEPQPEIYFLLENAFLLLKKHNPRIVTDAYILNLLALVGLEPQIDNCVLCGNMENELNWFSSLHGGVVCSKCHCSGEEEFSQGTRELYMQLRNIDFTNPKTFSVKGKNLMELEKIICKFLLFQIDKPLKSVEYLNKLKI